MLTICIILMHGKLKTKGLCLQLGPGLSAWGVPKDAWPADLRLPWSLHTKALEQRNWLDYMY